MMKVLIFLLLVACAEGRSLFPRLPLSLSKNESFLFQSDENVQNEKIVGGTVATPNEFPWQISLQRRSGLGSWDHSCGGSVYDRNFIISAAHCVIGASLTSLQVVTGAHSLSKNSGYEQIRSVSKFTMHPSYNTYTEENDIALIKLSSSLDFSNGKVAAIRLPTQGQTIDVATTCMVTGWGTTSSGGASSDVLRKVAVPVVTNRECSTLYETTIVSSMMCAGFVAGTADSCQGDSGGPLFTLNPSVLQGVVSWGFGCAQSGYPGVYTRVSSYVNWIENNAV